MMVGRRSLATETVGYGKLARHYGRRRQLENGPITEAAAAVKRGAIEGALRVGNQAGVGVGPIAVAERGGRKRI